MKQKDLKNKNVLYFDIETTGLDGKVNQIIEIAGIRINKDGTRHVFSELCYAPVILPEITKITGIDQTMVQSAREEKEVLDDFKEQMIKDVDVIITHNGLRFDIPFCKKRDKDFFKEASKGHQLLDTLPLSQIVFPLESNKLSEVAKLLGIQVNGAHRALQDVGILEEVANRLLDAKEVDLTILSAYQEKTLELKKAEQAFKKAEQDLLDELVKKDGYVLLDSGEAIGYKPKMIKTTFDTARFQKENDDLVVSLYQKSVFDSNAVKEMSPELYKQYLKEREEAPSINTRTYIK